MTGTTIDAAATAKNRLRMNSPSICTHTRARHVAQRSAAGETMFNENVAVYDEMLREADTVLKRYV
jgi:hypothetical protein